MAKLHDQGYSNAEIAYVLGVTDRTVIRDKRALGIPSPTRPPLSDEQRAKIRQLSEVEGWPPEEIAATLGISVRTAQDWGVRGPGEAWANTASRLAGRFPSLWMELRSGV